MKQAIRDCPFCNLEQQRVIKVGTYASVLLSNPRLMPGHTLVVPNRHIELPWELTAKELQEIFFEIWAIEQKLLAANIATGCDVRQNYRPFIPQGRVKVNHVHFHVLPRTSEDELYETSMKLETQLFIDLSNEERKQMTELLR